MRQRTARPNSGAPVADPGRDRGAVADAAADADQGAHGAATGGDAHP